MFVKVFSQIFDSSIVEKPETRFTFVDMLILADLNGVVDMTHEAIARRTNRPLEVIRQTITELEGPDPRSRTPDFGGARIKRLDEHRDWGWMIINYENFRELASEEQRREKTRLRVQRWRKEKKNASVTLGNDLPSASASAFAFLKEGVRGRFEEWMKYRRSLKKVKDPDTMFLKQAEWLKQFSETDQLEILEQSMRNGWIGLQLPKRQNKPKPVDPNQKYRDREFEEIIKPAMEAAKKKHEQQGKS